jgi:hypothetical protein
MSEMSQSQGPASGGMDLNPTDDMVPPGAPRDPDSPRNRSEFDGSEDVSPQDYGSEDVAPQESQDVSGTDPTAVPPSLNRESGGEESAPTAESSSDPMPDIAGQGNSGL